MSSGKETTKEQKEPEEWERREGRVLITDKMTYLCVWSEWMNSWISAVQSPYCRHRTVEEFKRCRICVKDGRVKCETDGGTTVEEVDVGELDERMQEVDEELEEREKEERKE